MKELRDLTGLTIHDVKPMQIPPNRLFQSLSFPLEVVGFRQPAVHAKGSGNDSLLRLGGLVSLGQGEGGPSSQREEGASHLSKASRLAHFLPAFFFFFITLKPRVE